MVIAIILRLLNQRHFFDVVNVRRGLRFSQSAIRKNIRTKNVMRIAVAYSMIQAPKQTDRGDPGTHMI